MAGLTLEWDEEVELPVVVVIHGWDAERGVPVVYPSLRRDGMHVAFETENALQAEIATLLSLPWSKDRTATVVSAIKAQAFIDDLAEKYVLEYATTGIGPLSVYGFTKEQEEKFRKGGA